MKTHTIDRCFQFGFKMKTSMSKMTMTTRPLLLLLFLVSTVTLQAQVFSGSPLTPEDRSKNREAKEAYWAKMKAAQVSTTATEYQIYKKGAPKGDFFLGMKQTFNEKGQQTRNEYFSKKSKLTNAYQTQFDDRGNLTEQVHTGRKSKLIQRTENQYERDVLQVSRTFFGKKGRPGLETMYVYDATGRLTEAKAILARNQKLKTRTLCTYHEDGSKKRIEKYNRRGKLTYATDYACDSEGKTLTASQAEQNIVVCERFERDAKGETIRVVETLSGEKRRYRSIAKYDSRNLLVEWTEYDEAGVVNLRLVHTYNDKGFTLTSEQYERGNKLQSRSEYERDAKGLAISEVRRDANGAILSKMRYTHTFF